MKIFKKAQILVVEFQTVARPIGKAEEVATFEARCEGRSGAKEWLMIDQEGQYFHVTKSGGWKRLSLADTVAWYLFSELRQDDEVGECSWTAEYHSAWLNTIEGALRQFEGTRVSQIELTPGAI